MPWIDEALSLLESDRRWGYRDEEGPATEPAALATLACAAHGRPEVAHRIATWLAEQQDKSGFVGIRGGDAAPHWPTAWAILAWSALNGPSERHPFRTQISRAVTWLLTIGGNALENVPEMGHNMGLVGWPWVEGTHSWLEPTALSVLALKSNGEAEHPRVREGVRLLFDRLLPSGGCNYGNTLVFGQELRPHLQSSGVALLALSGETPPSSDLRLSKTIELVEKWLSPNTTAASLAYGIMGLAAHGHNSVAPSEWLAHAFVRTRVRGANLPRISLLLLAARGVESPLVTLPASKAVHGSGPRNANDAPRKPAFLPASGSAP